MPEVLLRGVVEDDHRFIAASWFESYWKATARAQNIPYLAYKRGQDRVIRSILGRAEIKIAYFANVPEEILGYIVSEGLIVHYLYVKSPYRHVGIAHKLLAETPALTYTQRTKAGDKVALELGLIYDPYRILEGSPNEISGVQAGAGQADTTVR
jgi:GNAT superfamily N-acetyltransferase